jgi:hypothetical protein
VGKNLPHLPPTYHIRAGGRWGKNRIQVSGFRNQDQETVGVQQGVGGMQMAVGSGQFTIQNSDFRLAQPLLSSLATCPGLIAFRESALNLH